MTRAYLPACNRVFLKIQFAIAVVLLIMLSGLTSHLSALQQAPASGPKIWLQDNQSLPVVHTGAAAQAGLGQPLAMASADIDGDGIADLVVGHSAPGGGVIAIHRGNLDAFAPQSDASLQAIGRGEFPSPFLTDAPTFSVPVSPDFLALGNFTGDGQRDLIIAARGSNTLYVFPGDGLGGFGASQTVGVPSGVTSLAVGDFGPSAQFSTVLIGVGVGKNSSLIVLGGSAQGLNVTRALPLKGPASNFEFGNFGGGNDAAFLAGGQIFILRSSTLQLSQVSLPFTVRAFALGSFLFDRNGGAQIAALGADGSVNIVARGEFDPRTYTVGEFNSIRQARLLNQSVPLVPPTTFPANGWKVVETLPSVGTIAPGQTPVFFRTRVSSNGGDDVMWLNAGNNRMAVISHADVQPGTQTFAPGQVSIKPYSGAPLKALPLRVNIDGRPGVVAIHQGEGTPSVSMPIPDPTFFPNRTDDPVPTSPITNACNNVSNADVSSSCSLREAVLRANALAGTDTIQLAATTYTLTLAKVANDFTGNHGALYVNDSVNIVGAVDGAGNPTSIIQAGTIAYNAGTPNGVDMVIAVNEDISPITNATASISNVIIQNGHNRGTHGNDGDGGCMEFDTGSSGAATLTLTNVILQNCDTTQGSGGGLANFNFVVATGTGLATITGSTIQGNSVADNSGGSSTATGGGIWISDPSRIAMTGSKVLNNLAIQDTATTGIGSGGGITQTSKGTPGETPQTVIHSSTISGNKSAFQGGGIAATGNLLIDQGTIISGNQNGQNGAGAANGGGLFVNPAVPALSATLSKVTITGNTSTGTGGGVATGAIGAGPVTIQFSRFAGNTATNSGSNLENLGSATTATNNWWGTNAASSTIHTTTGTTTFDPFIVLTHSASPNPIKINQSDTLTGDMSNDNHGTAVGLPNLTQIIGLPITFDNPVLGSIPQAQPETLNASAQATATFNAGGISGRGSAHATVDQGIVSANSNLIASATEVSTTATITTVGKHNFAAGQTVVISGVGVGGYNGTFAILATPTATTFTYTTTAGLGASSGGTANVGIIILEPLKIIKSFVPATVAINAASTLTFSVNNPNVMAVDGSFTDTLPANLVVANPPSVTNTCGGTFAPLAGDTSVTFSNGSIAIGTCTITVHVSSAVDNIYSNSVTINSTAAGTGALSTSSANLTVINPPHITKAFGAATIPLNGTTSLTFTIDSNSNQNLTLTGVAFTDSLPAGLVVATPSNLNSTCSGTATAVDGSSSVSLSGASVAPNSSCTISLNVQGTTAGIKNNSVQVTSTNGGTGNTATANITVVAPPTISKAFGAASIPLNGSTSVTFTITNPNATVDLTGIAFSDTLPSTTGTLVVAAVPNVSSTCGGTATATAGTGVISLSGATVTHVSGSCTLSVDVTGTAAGDAVNTTGAITSTEGGTGTTSNTATIKIVAPPAISKAFGAATIPVNGTTTLTFTITNPAANTTGETGIAFSDTLTGGLQVDATPGVTNSCGGTVTATANTTSISLSGGAIATPGATCTIVVNVTGTQSGNISNTTGAVSSTNGGTGATSNTANLIVVSPPTITKAFGAASIPLNGTTSLTVTIQNPNTGITLNGIAFTDNLPAGLVVATPNALSNTCGGTATAVAGSGSISLSGGTLAASASCTVSVNVQGTTAGVKLNTTGAITSTEGGTGTASNTASLTVVAPPTISKAFTPTTIALNATSTLSFTITNPNTASALSGVAFTDNLPAGVVVAATPNVTGSCGSGTITATAGSGSISLSGGTLTASPAAGSSCTFSVDVTGTTAGSKSNTTGTVSSTEGGTGATSNTAVLTVVAAPSITKVFNPATIALNATTSLTFTITNPAANTVALSGVAFTDTLPTGLTVANASATVCGGTLTTTAPTGIALTGATIAVNSQCQFSVTVTGAASGQYTNTTGNVTSTNGGTGNTATANLTVASPPTTTKAFNPTAIALNANSTLSFTITNPNTNVPLTGVAFTDSLPSGLVVAATPNVTGSCGSGTITATAGSGSISLSGGTLTSSPAAGSSCTFSVSVTGTTAGVKNNSVTVTSTEGGAGTPATASLTVIAPPTISKAFNPTTIALNATSTLSFTITNPNTASALSGVAVTDNLPAGVAVAATPNVTGSCGSGTITALAGSGTITLSGGTLTASPAAGSSCTFSVEVTGTTAGAKSNTTDAVSSTEGGTGAASNTAVLKVEAPPSIAKVFNPSTIAQSDTTSLTFTITNPAANVDALTGVAFTDTLPTGLTVANASATVCGGTLTTTAPTGIALTGATINANSQCQFSVTVTGAAAGQYTNTTGNVTSTNGGTGNTATANLTVQVELPPSIAKVFNPSTIALNATTSLTFTITNPAANIAPLAGVAFTDTLPTGLTVANASATVCGGTLTTTAPTGIALSGATIAVNSQCQFSVTVTGAAAGQYTNTTGNVSSTNGGTGNTASANLTVGTPPTITKAFGAASILLNATTSLTFNISNPNTNLALTGVAFSDALPAGLQVATPNGLTSSCGGITTATAGSGSISLSGGTLAANASCTISLNVKGIAAGVQNNTTGPISSNESGAGATSNTASITVIGPPSIAKAFGAASINLNATTTLSFTITNPNATVALTGVGFGDTLPAGLAVANPNGLTGSCGAGTITTGTVSGFSVVNLSGGTIAAGGSCTFSVNVVGVTGGHKTNTTGTVTSSNAGSGNQATASIDVEAPDPTITKTHTGTFNRGQTGAQWIITVSNVGFGPTVGTVTVVDTLPNVQNPPVPTAISGTGWTCTLATLTCTRADALPSGSGYPPITLIVNIPQNIQNNFTNTAKVSGGGDVNPNNNTATDAISLGPPLVITAQSNASTVKAGSMAQFIFNVEDDDPALGMVSFGCSGLPVGTACTFNPPATNLPLSQVTMTVTTSSGASNAVSGQNFGPGSTPPFYALLLPVLGLLGMAMTGRKKKTRLRLAMVFAGVMMLLTFAGCGGTRGITTPPGSYQITVTAVTTTVQASAPVTLTVQ